MEFEKVIIETIVPDDKYGIMSLEAGQIVEVRCKPTMRDDLAKKIRGIIPHYSKKYNRKFSTKTTKLGVAIKREA